MSVSENSLKFRYIQSVILPFAYTDPYVPDISVGADRYVKWGSTASRVYTLQPNDVLEVLLISPNYYTLATQYCKQVALLSRINPTATSDLDARYGLNNDVFQEPETADSPSYLHKASACVIATGLVRFEGVVYQKSISDTAPAMSSITHPLTIKQEYNIQPNHHLYINALPSPTEKRTFIGDVYRPGQCIHQMARFTNIHGSNIQVNVSGVLLLEKTDPAYNVVPKVVKSMPLGVAAYLLDLLRSGYSFIVHNPFDVALAKAKRIEARWAITSALKLLIDRWHNFTAPTGANSKQLINFVIFYIE